MFLRTCIGLQNYVRLLRVYEGDWSDYRSFTLMVEVVLEGEQPLTFTRNYHL